MCKGWESSCSALLWFKWLFMWDTLTICFTECVYMCMCLCIYSERLTLWWLPSQQI